MQCLHGICNYTGSGDDDEWGVRTCSRYMGENFQSIPLRHTQIDQNQVYPFTLEKLDTGATVFRCKDVVAQVFELVDQTLPDWGLIINDKYRCLVCWVHLNIAFIFFMKPRGAFGFALPAVSVSAAVEAIEMRKAVRFCPDFFIHLLFIRSIDPKWIRSV